MTDIVNIELPEHLDIQRVEALHEQLEVALEEGKNINLLGAEVVKLDTSAIQVLVAFKKEIEMHHLELKWVDPSPAVVDVVSFLSLNSEIGMENQKVGETS